MYSVKRSGMLLPIILALTISDSVLADIVIVGHPSAPTLNKSQAEQIFLGKTRLFPNQTEVKPLDLPHETTIYGEFYHLLANKSSMKIRAYWSRMIFTGAAEPPRIVADSDELMQAILDDPRLIGYIDRDETDNRVKILWPDSN